MLYKSLKTVKIEKVSMKLTELVNKAKASLLRNRIMYAGGEEFENPESTKYTPNLFMGIGEGLLEAQALSRGATKVPNELVDRYLALVRNSN